MSLKSFFFPQVVRTYESKFNKRVEIIEFAGQYRLDMGGLIQSGKIMADIWHQGLKDLLPKKFKPESALVLGFGGGSVAHLLAKKYPGIRIVGVDIDPVTIQIAHDYFDIDKVPNLTIVNDDAVKFIEKTKDHFDLTLVDCYKGYEIPEPFWDPKFLKKVKEHSRYLLVNRIYWDEFIKVSDDFVKKMREHFSIITTRTPSNLLLSVSDLPK